MGIGSLVNEVIRSRKKKKKRMIIFEGKTSFPYKGGKLNIGRFN